ncbi:MAG: hypothetical protein SGPRY_012242 [Prymnesium sp.]
MSVMDQQYEHMQEQSSEPMEVPSGSRIDGEVVAEEWPPRSSVTSNSMSHAVLMPLKCSAENPPHAWIERLKQSSLYRDDILLYVGVDADDLLWKQKHREEAEKLIDFIEVMSPADQPTGAVCIVWNRLAKRACEDGCNGALVLFGDDVTYLGDDGTYRGDDVTYQGIDSDWLPRIADTIGRSPLMLFHPVDMTDASVCTFPILSAEHVLLFGELFPPCFCNQGADPFLHELYRRVGRTRVLTDVYVNNARGGPVKGWPEQQEQPRPAYKPIPATWNDELMGEWAAKLALELDQDPLSVGSIDVLVPSYRCDIARLKSIQLVVARVRRAKLIIQVDDPGSADLQEVLSLEKHHTRVRVNPTNIGASCTRNQLLKEATASVILFLDDDVIPSHDVVEQYLTSMLSPSGRCLCGLVGRVIFPESHDVWHEATRMSDIIIAFDWPDGISPGNIVPWGVTASLCLWHKHAVIFDEQYAKTGGGEDLDFCLRVSQMAGLKWGKLSSAVVRHPFWERQPGATGILRYLQHFFKWTQGDGLLLDRHPEHVYYNLPNVIEISLPIFLFWGMSTLCLIWAVELVLEALKAWTSPHGHHLSKIDRVKAAMLSCIVKNVVDFGHYFYFLRRGRFTMCFGSRFDWFCGLIDRCKSEERRKFLVRWLCWILACWYSKGCGANRLGSLAAV